MMQVSKFWGKGKGKRREWNSGIVEKGMMELGYDDKTITLFCI